MSEKVTVTVHDESGEEDEQVTIEDDYVITCAGSCYLANVQTYKNGTHVLTVKGRKPLHARSSPDDPA